MGMMMEYRIASVTGRFIEIEMNNTDQNEEKVCKCIYRAIL